MRIKLLMVAVAIAFSSTGFAKSAEELLADANALYNQKTAFAKNEQVITDALATLEEAVAVATDLDTKYRALTLASKINAWKAAGHWNQTTEESVATFETAMDLAQQAIALGEDYELYADAKYVYAVAKSRWALLKGVTKVVGQWGDLRDLLEEIQLLDTIDGEAGEAIDSYGPSRILGRANFKLYKVPFVKAKFSDAMDYLEEAYEAVPNHSLNMIYYAEVLIRDDQFEKGCGLLTELVNADPATLFPGREVETEEDQKLALETKQDLCP